MITHVPDVIRNNDLSRILDTFRERYGRLSRVGRLNGLLIVDQDAKVLAVNNFFDTHLNYWDIGAIGAALYGVSKQGRDFLSAGDLDRATMIYDSKQFFVQNIGDIQLANGRTRELILIALGDIKMNIGLVVMQMRKLAPKILAQVKSDAHMQEVMQMSEKELCRHLETIRKEMFLYDTSSTS